jgi:hypothetical protein
MGRLRRTRATPRAIGRSVHAGSVLFATTLFTVGCVAHPVGPARDLDGFERKASTTAESALSTVQTVRLLADTAADGGTLSAYTAVAVSEQEDALGGLRGTFMSIQPPPGPDAADLRHRLSRTLTAAFDHVGDVRIEARRGHLDHLDNVAAPLAADADELRQLMDELG